MKKHILEQYTDLQAEEKDLVRRIRNIEAKLDQMERKGYLVTDSVSCGKRGKKPLGTRKIQGFPYPEYEEKQERLKMYKLQLELADQKLLQLLNEVEQYIESLEKSKDRRIMRYKYIDGLNWVQVAHRMGGKNTAESCRSAHNRVLGIKK